MSARSNLPHRRWGSTGEAGEGVAAAGGDRVARRYPAPAARDPSTTLRVVPLPICDGEDL